MNEIIFFGLKSCLLNQMQKKILHESGFRIEFIDIVSYPWEKQELARYFQSLKVEDWFNPLAAKLRMTEIKHLLDNRLEAIDFLLRNPIFIRRPLLKIGTQYEAGFEVKELEKILHTDIYKHYGRYEYCSENCPRIKMGLPPCANEVSKIRKLEGAMYKQGA